MLSFRSFSAVLFVLILVGGTGSVAAQERVVPPSAAAITLSFAPVVKAAAPSVVNVHSAETVRRRATLFSPRGQVRPRGASLGSGVVVTSDGLVVTNAHVVGEARSLLVSFNDRREYSATLLLKDERTDLAVLQIDREDEFPPLPLGDGVDVEVGDLVLAIGNPFGVGQTVTQGIVSALARTQVGVSDDRFFIQTDAAINPGNSGGALVDMRGRLVGINTAIYSRSGGSNGIGFAIPADMVALVVRSAQAGGRVRRPWFGARLQTVTRDLADAMGLERPGGVVVNEVLPGSPAERAGIRSGDVLLTLGGRDIVDADAFGYLYATQGTQGETVFLARRGDAERRVNVTLEPPPETVPRDARRLSGPSPFDGAIAVNLSPAMADELNLDLSLEGVALARVDRRSVARRVGLRRSDKVVSINGRRVRSTVQLERIASRRARYWDVVIERGGQKISLQMGG